MLVEIDVKKLSKEEVKALLTEMVESNIITCDILDAIRIETSEMKLPKEKNRIVDIIKRHFIEYDEVFRKLA